MCAFNFCLKAMQLKQKYAFCPFSSWTLQVKMNFMKLEVKISNFFVDTIYKSKSYVKLQTVINQLLKNIFKQSDSAKDIVKYFNDNVMNE